MPFYKTKDLYDLEKTRAGTWLASYEWPWEALEDIEKMLLALGETLPSAAFHHPADDVWVAKDATIAPTASITGPCIIDSGAEVRHCAFIRGNALVGKGAVVGNSTELKNCLLFDGVQVPHFNYIGDSILGHKAHMGAGAVTSNVKSDKALVIIRSGNQTMATGRKKVGAMVGDFAEVGCNSVLCPGSVVGRGSSIYPTSCVRGVVPEKTIFKNDGKTLPMEVRYNV